MAILSIMPAIDDGDSAFDFSVNLDGVIYNLRLDYQPYNEGWYMTAIRQSDGLLILGSRRVCVDQAWPLVINSSDDIWPGQIVCVSEDFTEADPVLDELGQGRRCGLLYYDAAEVASRRGEG